MSRRVPYLDQLPKGASAEFYDPEGTRQRHLDLPSPLPHSSPPLQGPRLAAAGVSPDEPAPVAIREWNRAVLNRARRIDLEA